MSRRIIKITVLMCFLCVGAEDTTRGGEFIRETLSPMQLAEITQCCATWSHLLPSTQTTRGRMVLSSLFPINSLFSQSVLESNIHLQFLEYRKGLIQNVLQCYVQRENYG